MYGSAVYHARISPSASTTPAVAAFFVDECDRDTSLVSIPHPEIHLVARFGPAARNGLDVHVFGARQRVHRKLIRAGQRMLTARLQLGASEAVLGVPASAVAGGLVTLDELWGESATRQLCDRLATARTTVDAASIVDGAIAERLSLVGTGRAYSQRVLHAAQRLAHVNVNAVALELGMSERHLRRLFHEAVGVSPKAFAKLVRFHRALRAARKDSGASWATIAAAAGYYDQAHLIGEFRAIAGATPRALLGELDAALPHAWDFCQGERKLRIRRTLAPGPQLSIDHGERDTV